MKYDSQTIATLEATPTQEYSADAVELMGVMNLREKKTGKPVDKPGEIFACLMAMGFQRQDEKMPIQQRAKQFVDQVRAELVASKRRSPSYDQVLQAMSKLGYARPTATRAGSEARAEARARKQWEQGSNQ